MSLDGIMSIATSGLQAAQQQLSVVSDNITNVNTPGYIRKVANQQTLVTGGTAAGVTTNQVTLAANQYLEAAQNQATSASGQADATFNILDQIQSQFGDLTDPNGLFNQAASTLSSAAQAAEDPSSAAGRQLRSSPTCPASSPKASRSPGWKSRTPVARPIARSPATFRRPTGCCRTSPV